VDGSGWPTRARSAGRTSRPRGWAAALAARFDLTTNKVRQEALTYSAFPLEKDRTPGRKWTHHQAAFQLARKIEPGAVEMERVSIARTYLKNPDLGSVAALKKAMREEAQRLHPEAPKSIKADRWLERLAELAADLERVAAKDRPACVAAVKEIVS
jgi:hypothetical protein